MNSERKREQEQEQELPSDGKDCSYALGNPT